jgi:hypothetical protein
MLSGARKMGVIDHRSAEFAKLALEVLDLSGKQIHLNS